MSKQECTVGGVMPAILEFDTVLLLDVTNCMATVLSDDIVSLMNVL